jgi:putative Holliday junction resolvase
MMREGATLPAGERPDRPIETEQGATTVTHRILAIDFGTKRMGLAVSDALGITAQGLATLERTRIDDDLERIRQTVEEYSVGSVLIGNPLSPAGEETAMSRLVAQFADKLRRRLGCPVDLWDERLTSVQANRLLREAGISIQKRRQAADRVAATLLLQSYLDYRHNQSDRASLGGALE